MKPAMHMRTSRGLAGFGGGRWGKVPQPPQWYSTSAQLPGVYPFAAGTSRPNIGAPLGRDMHVGTAVCGDPQTWYRSGLISSASMMLFGLNGNGKSSLGGRFMYSMAARGIAPAVFDPIKNEHGDAVAAMGGNVIRVGPDSTDKINLLDLGALGMLPRKSADGWETRCTGKPSARPSMPSPWSCRSAAARHYPTARMRRWQS